MICLIGLANAGLGCPQAYAQTVTGEAQIDMSAGYARILVHLEEEVESEVRVAGGIVVVAFKRPVDVGIEKLASAGSGYVGAARRDPDGRGFRIALNRKLTVNSMAAGERLYIDLLPETWTGLAPGLPKEVIEELSRRAREAERSLRAQRKLAMKNDKTARVRVATQPTFTRYVFELPDVVPVTSDRGTDELTLVFAARLKFDFGEIKSNLPSAVKSIESFDQSDSVSVRFGLTGKADVRMFREDKNYVVDIGASDAKESVAPVSPDDTARFMSKSAGKAGPPTGFEAPQNIPAPPVAQPVKPQTSGPPAGSNAVAEVKREAPTQSQPASPRIQVQPADAPKAEAAGNPPVTSVAPRQNTGGIAAEVRRQGDSLRVAFPFSAPTASAIFRRAGTLWLLFDTRSGIDLSAFAAEAGTFVRHAQGIALPDGFVVRLMLDRPRLVREIRGETWRLRSNTGGIPID